MKAILGMDKENENIKLSPLKIKATSKLPSVTLDMDAGLFEISGRSLPNETKSFYDPIIEWLTHYEKVSNFRTNFVFKLEYFNSSSSMAILAILLRLQSISMSGKEVLVTWHSEEEDMQESGFDYADIVNIPFKHIGLTNLD
ncbi:MAG: DUF1987 domain-containing protein [Flavobacteriales bacterium]|nr:DUF1987 domain-containing protein [Flavobacteriales bacterium]